MSKTPPGHDKVKCAFAQTLREVRHRTGLSQEDLALLAGIDRAYMSSLERGRYNPTFELVTRLVIPLKVSFAEFAAEFERNLRRSEREHNVR